MGLFSRRSLGAGLSGTVAAWQRASCGHPVRFCTECCSLGELEKVERPEEERKMV